MSEKIWRWVGKEMNGERHRTTPSHQQIKSFKAHNTPEKAECTRSSISAERKYLCVACLVSNIRTYVVRKQCREPAGRHKKIKYVYYKLNKGKEGVRARRKIILFSPQYPRDLLPRPGSSFLAPTRPTPLPP